MLCREIIEIIENRYPVKYALEWDNVGLLVGRYEKEVRRIYVALDATEAVISDAVKQKVDMLITHHPMIFNAVKRITDGDFIGRRILDLIQNDISYYAMHTNYDVLGMADLSAEKLGLKNTEVLEVTVKEGCPEGIGRAADMDVAMSLLECCELVKERFGLDTVKVFGDPKRPVKRLAVSPGAGKGMIGAALAQKADVLVTGDIDHHTGLDAVSQGLAVIDAGHYGIESIFVEDMERYLKAAVQDAEIEADSVRHPFLVV